MSPPFRTNATHVLETISRSQQEEKEWTAVELDDGHGPTKRWLVQTSKGAGGTIDAAKLVEVRVVRAGLTLSGSGQKPC